MLGWLLQTSLDVLVVLAHGSILAPVRCFGMDGDTCIIASPSTKLATHGEDISSGRGADVPADDNTPLLRRFVLLPWLFSW